VQIGDNRAAEWVRRSNPVALGLLFSGLAGQHETIFSDNEFWRKKYFNIYFVFKMSTTA
jgi:hypothetical protein